MSVDLIQVLDKVSGAPSVPPLSDYDDASSDWAETEYRATNGPDDVVIGHWSGEPGWVRIDDWPYTEVCVIRSGVVEIEDASGARRRFGTGDAFVIPQGFRGVWHTVEPCEKVFVGVPGGR